MKPTAGRIVHYKLSGGDAQDINRRRLDFMDFCRANPRPEQSGVFPGASGHIGHWGNQAAEGDVYPAMIVKTWSGTTVNLQVYLDGNDAYWATSRQEGDNPGQWMVPPRVPESVFSPVTGERIAAAAVHVK